MLGSKAGPTHLRGFSPVMAGGILSIAAGFAGQPLLSGGLFGLAAIAFVVLAGGDVVMAARHRDLFEAGGRDLQLALVLFAWVAACGVIGDRRGTLLEPAQHVLAVLALAGWVAALGAFARSLLHQPGGWRSWKVDGSWLLAVVAPQSLSILASSAAVQLTNSSLVDVSLCLWILGLATYSGLIGLILRRLVRGGVGIAGLTPDYWITMGALQISALAALDLVRAAAGLDSLGDARGVLDAIALATWVCGAAWIPILLVVEAARVRHQGFNLRYDALRWSTVFPLGMFSVATYEFARTVGQPALGTIAYAAFWVGLALALLNAGGAAPALARAFRKIW